MALRMCLKKSWALEAQALAHLLLIIYHSKRIIVRGEIKTRLDGANGRGTWGVCSLGRKCLEKCRKSVII